jgi:hypothetical protein
MVLSRLLFSTNITIKLLYEKFDKINILFVIYQTRKSSNKKPFFIFSRRNLKSSPEKCRKDIADFLKSVYNNKGVLLKLKKETAH